MKTFRVLLTLACALLSTAATAAERPATQAEITKMAVGRTISGVLQYGKDGRYNYIGGGSGTYTISDGEICIKIDDGRSRCDRIVIDGKDYFLINASGQRYPFSPHVSLRSPRPRGPASGWDGLWAGKAVLAGNATGPFEITISGKQATQYLYGGARRSVPIQSSTVSPDKVVMDVTNGKFATTVTLTRTGPHSATYEYSQPDAGGVRIVGNAYRQ